MVESDDEYDAQAGGPIELTEQECATIDQLSADPRDRPHACNVPHMDVALDVEGTRQSSSLNPVKKASPIERFRPNGRLSVSDLVSPAWCEVQFEYGLLQHRSWRVARRPNTFISREGKEIHVRQKTAELNDAILQEGHAVHSALEREVHPTKTEVKTVSLEEYWGLRLFNMISDLQTLMLIGKCREFRVMGFVQDHFVTGIIDEITRSPIPTDFSNSVIHKKRARGTSTPCTPTKPRPKRTKPKQNPSPEKVEQSRTINSFFPVTPRKSTHSGASSVNNSFIPTMENELMPGERFYKTHVLHLFDSKTRLSPSLPQDSATLSSRLQLMTYKRLLDTLLKLAPPFDFIKLWRRLGLNPTRPFSEAFVDQVRALSHTEKCVIKCVKGLEEYWWSAVRKLGVNSGEGDHDVETGSPVDSELTLVYRLRGSGLQRARKRKERTRSSLLSSSSESGEVSKDTNGLNSPEDTGAASGELPPNDLTESSSLIHTSQSQSETLSNDMNNYVDAMKARSPKYLDLDLQLALQESLKAAKESSLQRNLVDGFDKTNNENDLPHGTLPPVTNVYPKRPTKAGDIIGQKTFEHDDILLDAHLTSILAWWHGERDANGVVVEESYRCHSCEYIEGCEWREKKALELRGIKLALIDLWHLCNQIMHH